MVHNYRFLTSVGFRVEVTQLAASHLYPKDKEGRVKDINVEDI